MHWKRKLERNDRGISPQKRGKKQNLHILKYDEYDIALICSPKQSEILQGDKNFSKIIENMECYKLRQCYLVNGFIYQLGDFIFRIGIASISNESKYLICEVEFLGPKYISEGSPSILEFMVILDPKKGFKQTSVNYSEHFQINSEECTPKITAIDLLISLSCLNLNNI